MLICEFAWQSLRKDVEASLDHIDDELFANLVSRVSYLKMRREWYTSVSLSLSLSLSFALSLYLSLSRALSLSLSHTRALSRSY